MIKYTYHCTRSGKWWAISVPKVRGVRTQARRLDQAEAMVREALALVLDIDPESFTVDRVIDGEVAEIADRVQRVRDHADQLHRAANKVTVAAIDELQGHGLSLRDIGTVLGLSHQRVGQLANERPGGLKIETVVPAADTTSRSLPLPEVDTPVFPTSARMAEQLAALAEPTSLRMAEQLAALAEPKSLRMAEQLAALAEPTSLRMAEQLATFSEQIALTIQPLIAQWRSAMEPLREQFRDAIEPLLRQMSEDWIASAAATALSAERPGQAMFDFVHELRPELADEIRGTDADPSDDDSRLPVFLGRIRELAAAA